MSAVIAAVHGPRQAQAKAENAEHAIVEVIFKPRSGFQGKNLHFFLLLYNPLQQVHTDHCSHRQCSSGLRGYSEADSGGDDTIGHVPSHLHHGGRTSKISNKYG
jgi:hypothetical protein